MTDVYTPTPTHRDTIAVPNDADEPTGALFAVPFANLADECAHLRGATGVARPLVWIPHSSVIPQGGDGSTLAKWEYDAQSDGAGWVQHDVVSNKQLYWLVDRPVGVRLTGATLGLRGKWNGNDHSGSGLLPSMPSIALIHVSSNGVINTDVAAVFDPSASVAAYEAAHTFSFVPFNVTLEDNRQYFFVVSGESGANAIARALMVTGVAYTWEYP